MRSSGTSFVSPPVTYCSSSSVQSGSPVGNVLARAHESQHVSPYQAGAALPGQVNQGVHGITGNSYPSNSQQSFQGFSVSNPNPSDLERLSSDQMSNLVLEEVDLRDLDIYLRNNN